MGSGRNKKKIEQRKRKKERDKKRRYHDHINENKENLSRRDRMCTTKKRFSNKLNALSFSSRNTTQFSGYARVYKCPYCSGWHITTSEKIY